MLTVWDTRLAFISSHLAAHEGQKHCHQRNSNIKEILGERWPSTIVSPSHAAVHLGCQVNSSGSSVFLE